MKKLILALFMLPLQATPPKVIISKITTFKAATAAVFINHMYQVKRGITIVKGKK